MKYRVRATEDDEEFFEDEMDPDEEGSDEGFASSGGEGPAFLPMFTGLLRADGSPILKHPIVMRMGFHPENKKYYLPTMEDSDIPTAGSVIGWTYDRMKKSEK